jgi:glycosyltransferase involved in cell wall biosynthesis
MKIFIDGHYLETGSNGVGTFIYKLYNNIIKNKRDYTFIFGISNEEIIKKLFDYDNVIIEKYKNKNKLRFYIDIPNIIKKYNVDIAHFQYIIPFIKNKNTKYINTMHDILFIDYPKYFSFYYRIIRIILFYISAKSCNIITTVSKYSKENIKKYFKIENKKIFLIPLATDNINKNNNSNNEKEIDCKIFYMLKNKKYILYVSRFEPRKEQDVLLKIYLDLELHKKNIELVFVGSKSIKIKSFDNIYKSIDINIRRHIHIFENIDNITLDWLYKNSTLVVYLSIAEGFGLPILEAAVRKKQVILIDNTAMKDFYFLKSGYIQIDKKNNINIDQLKNKIKLALDNRLYSKEELDKNEEIIKKYYNWERVSNEYIKIFEEIENEKKIGSSAISPGFPKNYTKGKIKAANIKK